jgi:hypothetical protein
MQKQLLLIGMLAFAAAGMGAAQQDKSKRPSPPASAECKFADGKSVKIDYSSPRMKGRKIFGELVPFGKVWRTGANEATSLVTTAPLRIGIATTMAAGKIEKGVLKTSKTTQVILGGLAIPAGSYTLYTVPEASKWTLIINKQTGQWGTKYDEAADLARIEMKVSQLGAPQENFTIALDGSGAKACTLRMEWETTRASVGIEEQ